MNPFERSVSMTIQAGSQQAEDPRGFQAGSVSHAPAQRKAIIAMSGGVDSSVAALLCLSLIHI